jgi:hypothetical protein
MGKTKSYTLFCLSIATLAFALIYSSPRLEQNASAAIFLPQAEPAGTRIWQVLPSKPLLAKQSFSLYTSPPAQFVTYGRREYGINLVWIRSKPQTDNFTLSRASGAGGQINYGDVVALKEKTGGYIYYKSRKYGINLEFSAQPVYEWEVRGGRTGTPVVQGKWGDSPNNISDVMISLYNRTINCYVVYGTREYGINLVWKGGPRC